MALIRLKTAQIAGIRSAIAEKRQSNRCPLCERAFGSRVIACLDHDHVTGLVRGVLCKNCNGVEGKIKSLAVRGRMSLSMTKYLQNVSEYWEFYSTDRTGLLHPVHLTPSEKVEKRKLKAKKLRAAKRK